MRSSGHIVRLLFVLIVILPMAALAFYLITYSKDQYKSKFAFLVSSETISSPLDFLSVSSTSPDSHILADFIRSPEIVDLIDKDLDLRAIYSKGGMDPLYLIDEEASREDLADFWEDMLTVYHDQASGIISVEVFTFAPEDAPLIANAIIEKSRTLINRISNVAEEDKLAHVRTERDQALLNLRETQRRLTDFRADFQIVDPEANLQVQVELIKSLQVKYVESLIELELMRDVLSSNDTRISQAERKISVLLENIELEKRKIGTTDSLSEEERNTLVSIFDEYERIAIDIELDREIYSSAIRAYAVALSEANIQDKYLVDYIAPVEPEESQYPKRYMIFFLSLIASFLIWFTACLVYYSIRDRA